MWGRSGGRNSILLYIVFPIVERFEILSPSEEDQGKQKGRGCSLKNFKGELPFREGSQSPSSAVLPGAPIPAGDPRGLAEVSPTAARAAGGETTGEPPYHSRRADAEHGKLGEQNGAAMKRSLPSSCLAGHLCRLLPGGQERWEAGILPVRTHGFPLDFRNPSRTCVRAGRGHEPNLCSITYLCCHIISRRLKDIIFICRFFPPSVAGGSATHQTRRKVCVFFYIKFVAELRGFLDHLLRLFMLK